MHYAKCLFYHDVAHLSFVIMQKSSFFLKVRGSLWLCGRIQDSRTRYPGIETYWSVLEQDTLVSPQYRLNDQEAVAMFQHE